MGTTPTLPGGIWKSRNNQGTIPGFQFFRVWDCSVFWVCPYYSIPESWSEAALFWSGFFIQGLRHFRNDRLIHTTYYLVTIVV